MGKSKKANINIRVDESLKDEATLLFKEMGMDMTTAITMFLKQAVFDYGLPFVPSVRRTPNAVTRQAMLDAESESNLESFDSVDEWWASLNED